MKLNKLKIKKIFYCVIGIILLIAIFLNTYLLLKYDILPLRYMIIYYILVGLIPILLIMYTLFRRRKSKLKVFFACIEILYIILLFIVFIYLNKTFNFIDKFTNNYKYETKNYYVLVNNNSKYKKINDIKGENLGYTKGLDESIDHAIKELNKKVKINEMPFDGYGEMLEKIESDDIQAILMQQGYYDMLLESDEELHNKLKILYKFSIKEKVNEITRDVDVTKDTFNIYVSGIDSYGSVTDKTRSDVNIIMNINPKTNNILMINVPRDYYVELAGVNQKDKLTHAGIYGVEMSTKTLENLFDIEINYFIKVNYNALIKLVDALDGVDVESEYSFTSGFHYIHFKKGINHVNGKAALEFVRTRKAFNDGDRVRGENQQRMIKAIIEKATSAQFLIKYDQILKSIEGNFTTNLSTDKISKLINFQLDRMPNWNIKSISVNGSDGSDYTYTYPSQPLYVMIPNEETIEEAKEALKQNK